MHGCISGQMNESDISNTYGHDIVQKRITLGQSWGKPYSQQFN